MDLKENEGYKGFKESEDLRVFKEIKVPQDLKGFKGYKGFKEIEDLRDLKEIKDP